MTPFLLFAALALVLGASSLRLSLTNASRPAFARAAAVHMSEPGFSGALGSGAAVRNLLF